MESSRVVSHTTGFATYTTTPGLNNGSGGSGSSGLSESAKKTIGGVVGGVGGAILLGGIAIVFWRLRSKKRHAADEDDDIMSGTTDSYGEHKRQGAQPFQSTLDQYHAPGKVNAAANF